MANLKPSELPQVRSIRDEDIFIVETDPNNVFNLSVNKIEKGDLFSGYLNDVTNIGLGEAIYSGTSGTNILLKSLVQGPGLAISDRGQDLVISFTGSEESTTASNIGLGLGLISGTSNFDIKVKSLSGGSNIQLSETDNTFVFDFIGQTEATTISNIGDGVPLVTEISDVDFGVRTISGGSKISVENSGATVFVDFTGQEMEPTTISSVGDGVSLVTEISDVDFWISSISGGSNIAVENSGQTVFVDFTGQGMEPTTVSNIGSGVYLVSGIDGADIKVRSIFGGSNIAVENSGETVFVDFTGEATTISSVGDGVPLVSGISDEDFWVSSISGGSNIAVENSGQTVFIDFTGHAGGGSSQSIPFAFFSDGVNNGGIISKTYYSTPTSSTYLSGIDVDSASDITLYLRWDGPDNSYMGSGFIDGQQIPTGNITELGSYTRRFEGYISGLNLVGKTEVTGVANGFTGIISLQEAGAGPTPLHVTIDDIFSATPKVGENLGTTDLKGGDTINVFATFGTSDVTGIKVYDSGISDGISYSSYSLTDTGDGNHTATIPIEINGSRVGLQGVSLVANNNFGTAGNNVTSLNQISLDQTYPSVSASNPTSYNGRSDGLREGELTTFSNTISNWTNGIDYILYETLSSDISITGSGSYQNPKTVNYAQGIYNNSDNLRINVSRTGNGATDFSDVKIKIANGPVITGINMSGLASSATSPNIIGLSEIKDGDTVDTEVYVDGNGVAGNNINLYVLNDGVSDGTQQNYSSYSYSTMGDGSFKYTVPVEVTSLTARDGARPVSMRPRNNFGTIGDDFTSTDTAIVNNSDYPSVSISSIIYPGSQEALKDAEFATVSNNVTTYDGVVYSSPNGDLTIFNDTTFEASKSSSRQAGNYNIFIDNFTITATKNSNGMVRSDSTVVKIAHVAMELNILNLSSPLESSLSGISDDFNLNSTQHFLSIPSLSTDGAQTSPSQLDYTSSGTNTNSNHFRITVRDSDTKGTFAWQVSGDNLAALPTTSITSNPNYILEGFSERTITASPTSLGAGLANIGTSVSDPSNVNMENISEGGSGPNAGTVYSPQITGDGIQMTNSFDINNKFVITDSAGLTNSTGDHLFNMDKLNRAANTAVLNPAQFIVSED